MRRKILTLLLIGLCVSFIILSGIAIYFRSAMQDDLSRLGEDFGETTSEYFDARQRSWYKEAKQADKITFSKIFIDEDGDRAITCAAPYYYGSEFAGVVGIGCDINTWYDLLVKTVISEGRTCFILNSEGNVVLSSGDNSFFAATVEDNDLTESPNEKIAALAKKMIAKKTGIDEVYSDCELVYVSYAPMEASGWSMGILTPNSEVVEAADDTRNYFLE